MRRITFYGGMMNDKFTLDELENLEIENSKIVADWGTTIVFAPHPDDESLGCGGTIALLREFGVPVKVITVSDGTLSHPNSTKYPKEKLRDLRETEMKNALEILGVEDDEISFLRYPDRSVPNETAADFNHAVKLVKEIFEIEKPQTVLVPWRRDPHPDHRAVWQIVRAAMMQSNCQARRLEYPIWLWEMAQADDLPAEKNIRVRRLDISRVVGKKQFAIAAHRSQTTDLIDDDPSGFRLSSEVLAHFAAPHEVFLEEV